MNICTLPSAAHDARGVLHRADAEAPSPPVLPYGIRAMIGLSLVRKGAAARALAQAERQVDQALNQLRQAEVDFARSRAQAAAHNTARHGCKSYPDVLARAILDTRAAQASRDRLLATQAEMLRTHARHVEQAQARLEITRRACRDADRRNDMLRRWLQKLEEATDQT